MSNGPLDFSLAASFDWETLLPVVFFVLYGIAQLLGSKKKKPGEEEETIEDVDMEERARQIREEIRRKIEERRQAREGQSSPAPQPAPAQRRARYDPTMPESQQRRFQQPESQRPEPPQPRPQPVARSRPEPAMPRQSGIEERLQEQRAILERARKEQREAKAKARQMMAAAGAGRSRQQHSPAAVSSGNLRDQLLADLRNPLSTRKAVLLREVLGTPLGLK